MLQSPNRRCDQTPLANAGEVLSCMEQKKLLMKPYYLGNENVPWKFSPAYPVPTQVLTFSISAFSGIWRLTHTELIQLPSTIVR